MYYDIDKFIENETIREFTDTVKQKLINGERVKLEGIGVLRPKFRKVKNPNGREFSIKIVVDETPEFRESIINSYCEDMSRFNKKDA